MSAHRIAWLICALLALAGLAVGYRAYTGRAAATVVVEWSTASELNTAGFNLYRSDTPDGPFIRVNEELIPASPDPLIGGFYSFTDADVVAGHTYYYQLEDVETNGTTTRHGPIEVKAEAGARGAMWMAIVLTAVALAGFGLLTLSSRWRTHS